MNAKQFLSEKEFQVIQDTDFLLTKAKIIEKLWSQFEKLRNELHLVVIDSSFNFLAEVDAENGKIFRGENYRKLPYVVLDFPKLYSRESIFSFRTMFWWGNFYSLTLHLQGEALKKYLKIILENIDKTRNNNVFICINNTPWEYTYETNNYRLIDGIKRDELEEIINGRSFLKLSRKLNVSNDDSLFPFCVATMKLYLTILKTS